MNHTEIVKPPQPSRPGERRKKRRWGDLPSTSETKELPDQSPVKKGRTNESKDVKTKTVALQQSISERLAALKARKLKASNPPTAAVKRKADEDIIPRSKLAEAETTKPSQLKKAKVYDLDMSITTPLFRANKEKEATLKPEKKINPYLIHLEQQEEDSSADQLGPKLLDNRLAGGQVVKTRQRNKALKFVEPGSYIEKAERKRIKSENATKSGFVSGRKVGTFVKSIGVAEVSEDYYGSNEAGTNAHEDINKLVPRSDALEESIDGSTAGSGGVVVIPIPLVMEWWDTELLPSKLKKEVVNREGNAVTALAKKRMKSFGMSKT